MTRLPTVMNQGWFDLVDSVVGDLSGLAVEVETGLTEAQGGLSGLAEGVEHGVEDVQTRAMDVIHVADTTAEQVPEPMDDRTRTTEQATSSPLQCSRCPFPDPPPPFAGGDCVRV